MNRYSYTRNNPLKYNDPTGHAEECGDNNDTCEDFWDEDSEIAFYRNLLEDRYNWTLDGDYSLDELRKMYFEATSIQEYVDNITNGNGLEWMRVYLGNVTIKPGVPNTITERGMGLPNTVYISPDYLKKPGHLIHELGHIWDWRTSTECSGRCANGAAGGVSDSIINVLHRGKNPLSAGVSCRWCDGSEKKYIPKEYQFSPSKNYGNNSTMDYLAETFRLSVQSAGGGAPQSARLIMEYYIKEQAAHLP